MDNFKNLNVLICDDSITNSLILMELVEKEVNANVTILTDPRKIAATLVEQSIDLILLDLEMPYMNGFEVMEEVREKYDADQLPILIITGVKGRETRNNALINGANDFLNKPIDQVEVVLRVRNLLKIRNSYILHEKNNCILENQVELRTAELNESIGELLHSLAVAGELKDDETGKHVLRVGQYARILADGVGLPKKLSEMIELAAPLHDIGKIGIPDKILLKPGKLDVGEREEMNKHTTHALSLIGFHNSPLIQMAKSIALNHHERWDGTGYPSKLAGESIPVEGRITAIADVFDALTTKRPYKDAWLVDDAVNYIEEQSGKSFDPALVSVFMQKIPDIVKVKVALAD
jgi:putative two-component system response regulator